MSKLSPGVGFETLDWRDGCRPAHRNLCPLGKERKRRRGEVYSTGLIRAKGADSVELILNLLSQFGRAVAGPAAASVGAWLIATLRARMRDAPARQVLQTLRDLGCLSE